MNKILKSILPPITVKLYYRLTKVDHDKNPNWLFDGDDELFKRIIGQCKVYGEYGCGKSTRWMLANTQARVFAVDTDKVWVDHVRQDNSQYADRLKIKWVDVGPIISWGTPKYYTNLQNYPQYMNHPWEQDVLPDTVMIDGRFRVCCFLTCLKHAPAGTRLLFDDYKDRFMYHIVEEFTKPVDSFRRQFLFIAPGIEKLDTGKVDELIEKFVMVWD